MKLRKQAPAKAAIVGVTLGLLAALFALIQSEPRLSAQTDAEPTPPPQPVDYNRFFAPNSLPPGAPPAPVVIPPQPHSRTRGS